MRAWRRNIALVLTGCTAAVTAGAAAARSPEDRCSELYDIYYRYLRDHDHHHDGDQAHADTAKYFCESGRTDEGLHTLEGLLARSLIPFPKE